MGQNGPRSRAHLSVPVVRLFLQLKCFMKVTTKHEWQPCGRSRINEKRNLNLIMFVLQNLAQHLLVNGYVGGHFTHRCVSLLSQRTFGENIQWRYLTSKWEFCHHLSLFLPSTKALAQKCEQMSVQVSSTDLGSEESKNQVTFSLDFRGAGPRLQLEPLIITNNRDLLMGDRMGYESHKKESPPP